MTTPRVAEPAEMADKINSMAKRGTIPAFKVRLKCADPGYRPVDLE